MTTIHDNHLFGKHKTWLATNAGYKYLIHYPTSAQTITAVAQKTIGLFTETTITLANMAIKSSYPCLHKYSLTKTQRDHH